ncbi:MAG: trigger factor [Acidimicrobiales bacterium]
MRATVTALDNNRVKLTVEVDLDEMSEAIDLAAKELSRQVSVKGFRKGKVPKNVLVAHLGGAEVLRGEAIRESLPNFYARAVADTLIDPIGQPQIDITAGEEEGPLVFDAEVEVRPEVAISGYQALRVTIPSPQVTDVEVEAQIDRYRETDAVLREVERPIVSGDLVTMDVKVTKVASEDEPLEMAEYMYTVGSGTITDGVDELILGLRAGETLSVNGNLEPGVVATFDMNLKQVRERELPELSDEWVAENTDWQGVDDMRDSILAQLRSRKIIEAQMSQRDAMLMALSDLVPEAEVSETLVAAETEERLHDLGHRLGEQNLSLETFLQVTNQTPEVLLEKLREDARRAVRIDLGLRAIAREEGLEPTSEEIDEELDKTAASMATDADVLRANLRDTGRTVAFSAEVAKMKASRWLLEHVTFVDPQGVEVNRELLSQDQSGELGA